MNGLARRQVPRRDHNALAEFCHGACFHALPTQTAHNVRREASGPQFSRQLINAFARPHPLHGHSLKFPGVSLSLHGASVPGNCAQFCVSLQGFTPLVPPD